MFNKNVLIISFAFSLLMPVSIYASCFWSGVGEVLVPGLGYAINSQWDKASIVGGLRLAAGSEYLSNRYDSNDYYQENIDDVYVVTDKEDSESGKKEHDYYWNIESWKARFYRSQYIYLGMMSVWDLYQDCEPNNELYSMSLAPLNLPHFYKKWYFWAPLALTYTLHQSYAENNVFRYHLGRGLTESEFRKDAFLNDYSVGLWEEMFFRGVLQDYFFKVMKNDWNWSSDSSRHFAIWSAAIIFGLAHTSPYNATPGLATLIGAYLGYVYQPSIDEFDLTTAIAIHAWWDIIATFAILNSASFEETDEPIEIPVFSVSFRF